MFRKLMIEVNIYLNFLDIHLVSCLSYFPLWQFWLRFWFCFAFGLKLPEIISDWRWSSNRDSCSSFSSSSVCCIGYQVAVGSNYLLFRLLPPDTSFVAFTQHGTMCQEKWAQFDHSENFLQNTVIKVSD